MSNDTMRRKHQHFLVLVVACVATAPAFAQRGALTVPRNLDQLTDRASDIVRGRVVSAHVEKHPELSNLDTVVVTLHLTDTLKGAAKGTFTFRQYIWDFRDNLDAAGYRKGQEFLLLMIAPSRYGLSSPAGLDQGRFRIERDNSGREMAINGAGNARLFEGLNHATDKGASALTPAQASLVAKHRKGAIELNELTAMIRAFTRND
jgi:hypothetical protein